MKKDFLDKQAQRCQERIARRKEEAELRLQTEETKTELKIGLLEFKLQNEEVLFEENEEERVEYLAAYEDQIQQYPEPNEASDKKAKMMLWGVLAFDLIAGIATAGTVFAEGLLSMIAISVSMAALFYFTGKMTAKTAKDPDASEADKQVKGALQMVTFFLILSTSIMRAMHASEGEGIGMTVFIFIAMLCIGTIAYQITCAIFYEAYQPIKTQVYHSLYQLARKHDKQRIDLHEKIVNNRLALTEFILSNQLELNRTIEQMEDNLDNANIANVREEENRKIQEVTSAKQAEQLQVEESEKVAAQSAANVEAEQLKVAAEQRKRDRMKRRLNRNGVATLLLALFSLTFMGCEFEPMTTAQSIFIDPSAGAVNITDALVTGEEALALLGNDLAQPSSASGRIDIFVMQPQTGTEHYSVAIPMLSVTAALEQKKTRKEIQHFVREWDELVPNIKFPEEGYSQSRITKPLFEAIHYTRNQSHDARRILLYTDLLEHTSEISFLKMSPQQIRDNVTDITEFIDHYCQCDTLDGIEIIFAYKSKNESKYDQHRVEIERIFKSYFLDKGAIVRHF